MRLIDADKFTEKCKEIIHEENDNSVKITWAIAYDNFIDEINEQPTVDAVPVVRCKDCIYCSKKDCWTESGKATLSSCWNEKGMFTYVLDNDYCSHGYRRDDNG